MKNKNRTLSLFFFTAKIKIGLRTSLFPPLENDNRTSYQVLLSGKKNRTSQLFFSLRKIKIGLRTYCFLCEKKDQTLHQFFPHRKKKMDFAPNFFFTKTKDRISHQFFLRAQMAIGRYTSIFLSAKRTKRTTGLQTQFYHSEK